MIVVLNAIATGGALLLCLIILAIHWLDTR